MSSLCISNLRFNRGAPKKGVVNWLGVLSAMLLLFAAGFSFVWLLHHPHTHTATNPQVSPRRGDSALTTTGLHFMSDRSSGTFLYFGTSATILTSYTPGVSLWLRTLFFLDPYEPVQVADVKAAGVNAWEDGSLAENPIYQSCGSSNFALSGGSDPICGNWQLSSSRLELFHSAAGCRCWPSSKSKWSINSPG